MTETLRRGYPGMKSVKDMPVVQDGPPPGGFPSIRYARRLPSTGPTGFSLFAVATAVMAFGFYRVGEHNKHGRVLKAEKLTARNTIYPILQAEEDRRHALPSASEQNGVQQRVEIAADKGDVSDENEMRRYVQAKLKALENEAKIMKDVPNWKVGEPVYLTKRWVPPAQPVGAWGE